MNISFKTFSSAGSDHWNIRVAHICNATSQQLQEPCESQPGRHSRHFFPSMLVQHPARRRPRAGLCEAQNERDKPVRLRARLQRRERGDGNGMEPSHQPIHLRSWKSSPALDPRFPSVRGKPAGLAEASHPARPAGSSPCSRSTALFVKSRPKAPPAGCGSVTGRVTSDLRGHSSSPEHGPAKASPLPTGTRSTVTLREGPAAPASLLSADDTSCFPQRCPEPRKELPSVTQPGQTLPADTSVVFDTCPGRGSLLIIIPRILSSPRLREISGGFAQRGSLFGAQGF